MELRLPGVNLPRLCGRVGGVKSCHGDMSAALRENIGLPRRHGTWERGKKSCHSVEGAALHQRAGFPVTPGSAFAPTTAVSQTQLPRLPSAPSELGLGRGVYCGDMGRRFAGMALGCGAQNGTRRGGKKGGAQNGL